jgi:hypothetical protein
MSNIFSRATALASAGDGVDARAITSTGRRREAVELDLGEAHAIASGVSTRSGNWPFR